MPRDAKSYAPRMSPSTWEQHRCRIKMLFVDQGKTLSKVAEIMKIYGLYASESQYERQLKTWGIRKNRTRDEWHLINRVVEERRRQGKESIVLINGVEQSKEKLDREFARSGYREHGGLKHSLPEDIQVLSPPANTSMTDSLLDHSSRNDGLLFLVRQKSTHLMEQIGTVIAKRAEGIFLWVNLVVRELQNSLGQSLYTELDSWLQSRFPHLVETLRLDSPSVSMPNHASPCNNTLRDRSPSPSGSWGVSSWDSMGVTSEEWVSRGWNVFFGAWG